MYKINFIPPLVFEIWKFKNPAIWLVKSIFAFNSKHIFSQTCNFNRIVKVIMVHYLKTKNLQNNGHFFAKIQKNPFWALSSKWDFFQKPGSVRFLKLRHFNFIWSFTKSMWPVLGKRVYLLTYWHNDSGEIIGSLFP